MNLNFEAESRKEKRVKLLKEAIRFTIAIIVVILLAWLIVKFFLMKASVIGTSMENTLSNGDHVIVNKGAYLLLSPGRNDVIAFFPEVKEGEEAIQDDSSILIRRVIGLPGETIQITDGVIYINNEPLEEKYNYEKMHSSGMAGSKIKLEEDEYFVLSDNRNDMDDSRNTTFTKVKTENIIGKVMIRLNPFSLIGGPTQEEK